jgi:hypothetical protein
MMGRREEQTYLNQEKQEAECRLYKWRFGGVMYWRIEEEVQYLFGSNDGNTSTLCLLRCKTDPLLLGTIQPQIFEGREWYRRHSNNLVH